jgi:hypothetical protein
LRLVQLFSQCGSQFNQFPDELGLLQGPALAVREGGERQQQVEAEDDLVLKGRKQELFGNLNNRQNIGKTNLATLKDF